MNASDQGERLALAVAVQHPDEEFAGRGVGKRVRTVGECEVAQVVSERDQQPVVVFAHRILDRQHMPVFRESEAVAPAGAAAQGDGAVLPGIAPPATEINSSGVRFWIGCGTQTTAGLKPRDLDCAAAPGLNSTVAMLQPGTPRLSRDARSCKLHDVQDPQSARPTMATSQRSTISWIIASGAGRV